MKRPPPLPAGESALLVDDSELLEGDVSSDPASGTKHGDKADNEFERRVTGVTVIRAGRRALDIAFLSDVFLLAGFDLDITTGGVFLPTYESFAIGDPLELQLELGDEVVRFEARVVWGIGVSSRSGQRPGFAASFERLEPRVTRVLQRYCRTFPPRFFEF